MSPGAEGQNRTGDTSIFSAVLYLLSYLGTNLSYVAPFQGVKNNRAAEPPADSLSSGISGPRRALTE